MKDKGTHWAIAFGMIILSLCMGLSVGKAWAAWKINAMLMDGVVIRDDVIEFADTDSQVTLAIPDIDRDTLFAVDSNDLLIEIVDNDSWIVLDCEPFTEVVIYTESGSELILSFEDDELAITGDANMTDAARMFFYEVLKPMADDYIKENK